MQFGLTPQNPNNNRWYYWVDQYEVVLKSLPGLVAFLQSREPLGTVITMKKILTSREKSRPFLLELVTITEIGKLLAAICYELEGDGPLIFRTYELVKRAQFILHEESRLPQNVINTCMNLATNELGAFDFAVFEANEKYCRGLITPARAYLANQFLKQTVASSLHVAKMAAMFNPLKARSMTLSDAMLSVTSFFSSFTPTVC